VNPSEWKVAKELLAAAIDVDVDQRTAFLRDHCDNPSLRAEIETLLKWHEPSDPLIADHDRVDLEPGSHVGPYVILDRIGRGGMGEVFLGSDPRLGRKVALKCLLSSVAGSDVKNRILREARAAAVINHPNVAAVYDVLEHADRVFIVMEYVEGESLATRLQRGALPIREVVAIGRQLASALRSAHEKGIVHRDLKPANVHVQPDGSVKVLDFGIAKSVRLRTPPDPDATTPPLVASETGQPGTPAYMAPEQLLGGSVDGRADLYALGLVLFEMSTAVRPFANQNVVFRLTKHAPRAADVKPGLPAELSDVIAKALEIDPERRFQTADVMEEALARVPIANRSWLTGPRAVAASVVVVIVLVLIVRQWTAQYPVSSGPKPVRSLAVLPLVNMSSDGSEDYFVDGITDGLITTLGRVTALRITARTSIMQLKRTTKPISTIARDLGVDAIVEGSAVLVAVGRDERVRVTVALVDPGTQAQIWADTVERGVSDVLVIQNEIVRALADKINAAVTPVERRTLSKRQTVDVTAYKEYLLGREQLAVRTEAALRLALEHFHKALESDPAYAPAHAGLADTYVLLAGDYGAISPSVGAGEAAANANRALAIDPNLAEAYASLGFADYFLKWDWSNAEARFARALELNPSYAAARQWYANYLSDIGREADALREMRRAFELDPLSAIISRDVAWPMFFARQYDDAIEQLQATLLKHPGYISAERLLARAYAQKGDFTRSIPLFESLKRRTDNPRTRCEVAWVYALAGRAADARRELASAYTIVSSRVYPYDVALVLTALNQKSRALDALQRAFDEHDPTMVNLRHDPRLDGLRSDPRFTELESQMRFPPIP
jgi:eukaryotic-like serine/threonine-protein kinase